MSEFKIGQCKSCGKTTGLKNDWCAPCSERLGGSFDNFFDDIFTQGKQDREDMGKDFLNKIFK